MMPKPLITLQGLSKNYIQNSRLHTILKNISFSVYSGELLAIVGASGSGKSTLMNILGLLDKPCTGTYWLNEQNIGACDDNQLATLRNQHIGFVFQQFNLLPRLTVHQNIALPLVYRAWNSTIIDENVLEILHKIKMVDYKDYYPLQLSGGQQQRIAIARALVGNPNIILADEPTGALDSRTGTEILDLFSSLHAEGRTIIMITHDNQIAKQCPRRIIMADGQIINEPEPCV